MPGEVSEGFLTKLTDRRARVYEAAERLLIEARSQDRMTAYTFSRSSAHTMPSAMVPSGNENNGTPRMFLGVAAVMPPLFSSESKFSLLVSVVPTNVLISLSCRTVSNEAQNTVTVLPCASPAFPETSKPGLLL